MDPTGTRYAEAPPVQVEVMIDAPPDRVWELISDITALPPTSPELRAVEWAEGHSGPIVGAAFVGHMKHPTLGREWSTTSHITECDPPRRFAWVVEDPDNPAASWSFTAEPRGGGTLLRQWARIGPGPSGLTPVIRNRPDREATIVHNRLREIEAYMTATLAALKQRAEAGPIAR